MSETETLAGQRIANFMTFVQQSELAVKGMSEKFPEQKPLFSAIFEVALAPPRNIFTFGCATMYRHHCIELLHRGRKGDLAGIGEPTAAEFFAYLSELQRSGTSLSGEYLKLLCELGVMVYVDSNVEDDRKIVEGCRTYLAAHGTNGSVLNAELCSTIRDSVRDPKRKGCEGQILEAQALIEARREGKNIVPLAGAA